MTWSQFYVFIIQVYLQDKFVRALLVSNNRNLSHALLIRRVFWLLSLKIQDRLAAGMAGSRILWKDFVAFSLLALLSSIVALLSHQLFLYGRLLYLEANHLPYSIPMNNNLCSLIVEMKVLELNLIGLAYHRSTSGTQQEWRSRFKLHLYQINHMNWQKGRVILKENPCALPRPQQKQISSIFSSFIFHSTNDFTSGTLIIVV